MTQRPKLRAHGRSRMAVYEFEGPFDEDTVERLLERAKAAGVVDQYDGHGTNAMSEYSAI